MREALDGFLQGAQALHAQACLLADLLEQSMSRSSLPNYWSKRSCTPLPI